MIATSSMATLFAATATDGSGGGESGGGLDNRQFPAAMPDLAPTKADASDNATRECPSLDNHSSTSPSNPSPPSVATESLPSTYATLPRTTKLDDEPNPFEQSFSDGISTGNSAAASRRILPPLAAIDSPARGVMFRKDEVMWDSLRAGPLSPSMLTGPARDKLARMGDPSSHQQEPQQQQQQRPGSMVKYAVIPSTTPSFSVDRAQLASSSSMLSTATSLMTTDEMAPPNDDKVPTPSSSFVKRTYPTSDHTAPSAPEIIHEQPAMKRRVQTKYTDDEEKRKNFLERNRQAAFKCRQRKKQWVKDLEVKAEYLVTSNEQLRIEAARLRDEIFHIKSLLQEHTSCHMNPQAVLEAINRPIPSPPDTAHQYSPSSATTSPTTIHHPM